MAAKSRCPRGFRKDASQQTQPVVFDGSTLKARLLDDHTLIAAIVGCFLSDIPRQVEALAAHIESGDRAGAERLAHSIKGASANVSGEALRAVAFEMEKAVAAGKMAKLPRLFPALESGFASLRASLVEFVNGCSVGRD
jgi:HPt (histidine-containing phosphotransfer) domain-containing protein